MRRIWRFPLILVRMKKPFLFCFAVCLAFAASAQKTYFVYLQTDNQSPFYVRMADKIYSSSTAGYLILSNLVDSTYTMGVGFPKSTAPETRFAVPVKQADKGYLLKNFSDGLALFDIEDLSVIKPVSTTKDNTVYETKTDKFSAVLSKAADDPSLLKVAVAKKEEPKPEPEKKEELTAKKEEPKPDQKETAIAKTEEKKSVEEKLKDTVTAKPIETVATKVEKEEEPIKTATASSQDAKPKVEEKQTASSKSVSNNAAEAVVYKPSTVVRRSESSTTEGFGVVYFDKMEEKTDTVRILIPPSRFSLEPTSQPTTTSELEKTPETVTSNPNQSNTKAQVDSPANEVKQKVEQKTATVTKAQNNSPCKELASDKDFMKLRKNMAAKSSDENMVFEAKKAFKLRCYTSEQVRYLSTLFLTPAGKYNFFDTAYNYVADKEGFAALQSEIKDEYYLKRFKALVGE